MKSLPADISACMLWMIGGGPTKGNSQGMNANFFFDQVSIAWKWDKEEKRMPLLNKIMAFVFD
ncbi:hypothetical protein [Sphingobacterium sp. arapr2]|uniref:hypothetical protein n=1 Tax=Sphingobacterium prati TaxID=2737006 RepID=UPI001556AD5B|nr:hypothetical protein [Sphingobacterium prati]